MTECERLYGLLAEVLDVARQPYHDRSCGETFTTCELCRGWEGVHTPTCPIPVIAAWLDQSEPVDEETP